MPASPGYLWQTWILQHKQNKILCMTGNFSKCTMICDFHTALKIPYVYEFIIKSCRQQMEVMQKLNTSCPHSVLILRGLSCQLSRWSIVGIGFRFVPLDSPMFVVSVTVFIFLQVCWCVGWALVGERLRNKLFWRCTQCMTFLSQLTQPADALNYYTPLLSMHD